MPRRERRKNYDVDVHLAELDDDADEAQRRHGEIMGQLKSIFFTTAISAIGLVLNLIFAQLPH
jgi:hypothetical protein